jgi:hypothetical protein
VTQTFYVQATDLGNQAVRLGSIAGFTQNADRGTVAQSTVEIDDPDGSRVIEDLRGFVVIEDACSDDHTYVGYISSHDQTRAASLITGAARRIALNIQDLNAALNFALITHSNFHYNRPAETDIERIDWLLANVFTTSIGIHDNGLIDTTNPVDLSKADLTGQFPQQVLDECSTLSGKNFFVYWDGVAGERSLAYFDAKDPSIYPSTLSISNVLSDLSSTCLYGSPAEGHFNADQVFSGALVSYSGGEVYVRAAGGRTIPRDTSMSAPSISSRTKAIAWGKKMLAANAFEDVRVNTTLHVPAAQVNLLLPGMGVNARFSHIDGWESGLDVRVLSRSVKQDQEDPDFYDVDVELGHPFLVTFNTGRPDNGRVFPSDQPPFVPAAGTAYTFVQSAKTADDTTDHDATFGSPTTAGNLLVGVGLVRTTGGATDTYAATWPDGWMQDIPDGGGGPVLDNRLQFITQAHKEADGTETTITVDFLVNGGSLPDGYIAIAEYVGDPAPTVTTDIGSYQSAIGTADVPTMSPAAGAPALIVYGAGHEPNYILSGASTGLVIREDTNSGGYRQSIALVDQIVNPASGSYAGTLTSPGGTDDFWWITAAAYSAAGSEPAIGQPVAPESATGDGSTVTFTTNYPYVPGSLVVKVNGVIVTDTETDPDTGVFTLAAAPAVGAVITWTYNVADPAPTGANNPPPSSNPPGVPPDPGTVQGGDGVYRQPQQEYVPAEVPDGMIVDFTIVPYIAGNTLVYINGLIQRKGIDWNELDPATGTIEFTTAPWTGASITVTAMPVVAASTGSGFGNPSLYGPGINADTKANLQNNASAVSHRFRSIGGVLSTVRWQQRGGPVYSGGTGGSYDITVEADVGGSPSGTPLATATYSPGNPGGSWTNYDEVTWSSPATLVAGTLYHIVFTNTDGSPGTNYVSVNELFIYGSSPLPAGAPRQPEFPDTDWAVLYGGVLQSRYTADMDLGYSGGSHQGMGYIQNMTTEYGTLSGAANMVRELFTVSGGDRTVTTASVRVRRSSGSADLILGLYTGADALVEAVAVPASLVPISAAGGDTGGSVWVGVRFLSPHVLTNGQTYYLRLSCASGTTYTAAPIRKGTTVGFDDATVFIDGAGQFTTNSGGTWTDLYTFDTDPPDLQCYFGTTT